MSVQKDHLRRLHNIVNTSEPRHRKKIEVIDWSREGIFGRVDRDLPTEYLLQFVLRDELAQVGDEERRTGRITHP